MFLPLERIRNAFLVILFVTASSAGQSLYNIYSPEHYHNKTSAFNKLSDSEESIFLSGQWFLSYQYGEDRNEEFNNFSLRRGYITVKKSFNENFSGRITTDISVDREGDGEGDIELRLKYCYLRYKTDDIAFFTKPYLEAGLVHRPWLGFEEAINRYRVQGTLYLERVDILSSADYGITAASLLGGEIDKQYQKTVNGKYPGKYGSVAFGIYNGGGYHAIENNMNKTFESRVTLRPVPSVIPGLQFTYTGAYGKGNEDFAPDWLLHTGYVSMEHEYFTAAGTYFTGEGNSAGTFVDSLGNANRTAGYSLFGELKFPSINTSLFGRYDYFEFEEYNDTKFTDRLIAGAAYHFFGKCKFVINFDSYDRHIPAPDKTWRIEAAVEVVY